MSRHNDNAPIGYTCSKIDSIIDKATFIKSEIEYIKENPNQDNETEIENIINESLYIISDMEDIRGDNETLREWGNDEFKRAEDLEYELNEMTNKCSDLESEIEGLNDRIKELEEELNEVELKIN